MQAVATKYKLIKKVKDDRFDEEQLHQYELLINTGSKDLQVGVVDSQDKKLLLLEDYALANVQSHDELLAALKDIYDNHYLLHAGFWKAVKIGIKNNKFCQVPTALFEESKSATYLKFNAHVDEANETVLHCESKGSESVTVFALRTDLHDWLDGLYHRTQRSFFHQSAALVEGVLKESDRQSDSPLYIYVDRFKLHILSAQNGKLIYYNQFAIKQFPDYVKYIMLALKGLNMDQLSSRIILWGYIGKNSPHYQEFVKYVRNVSFGGRPNHLKFSYAFDEVQEHHYFDLYSLNLL